MGFLSVITELIVGFMVPGMYTTFSLHDGGQLVDWQRRSGKPNAMMM